MRVWRFLGGVILAAMIVFGAGVAFGKNYPNKPVRIITSEAGGGSDFLARLIAQGLTARLGQPVIVENRGGSGAIAIEIVGKVPPDGYSLLLSGSTLWLLQFMRDKVPWDPLREFLPITIVNMTPLVLVAHPSMTAKSVNELIALAKAKPGALNFSSGPSGGPSNLAAELFIAMAGVKIVRITYRGTAPAVNGLLGGEVQMMFANAGAVMPHINAGKLRALAITSAQPSPLFPGVPTVAASGLRGYEVVSRTGIFAPAKTPAAIINRLNEEVTRVLDRPETKEAFLNAGTQAVGGSSDQAASTIKSEMATVGKMIKDIGIRAE